MGVRTSGVDGLYLRRLYEHTLFGGRCGAFAPLFSLLHKIGAGDFHLDAVELAELGIKAPGLIHKSKAGGGKRFLCTVIVGKRIKKNAIE